jgi:cholesterol oxidase
MLGAGMANPDVIVVGSGFGGAVMAARLAESGAKVLILERGPFWGADDEPDRRPFPRGVRMGGALRNVWWSKGRRARNVTINRQGLFEIHVFKSLWTMGASGVGGGSLVYANAQADPRDDYWDLFPPEITAGEMRPYFEKATQVVRPQILPDWKERQEPLKSALEVSGNGSTAPVNLAVTFTKHANETEPGLHTEACRMCGECIMGCRYRAKNTLDRTYLEHAVHHGAEILPLSEVTHLGPVGDGYRVRWVDHATRRTHAAEARRVVLAAGALNTMRLLHQSWRDGVIDRLPETLGQRFSPNGDYINLIWKAGVEQAAPGAVFNALRDYGAANDPYFIGDASAPTTALPLPGKMRRDLDASRFLFVMGADNASGRLTYDGHGLRFAKGRSMDREFFDGADRVARELASHYRPEGLRTNLPFGSKSESLATFHIIGGAPMAKRMEDSAVDHTGQLRGHPGLYLSDSSVLPGPPGVPPSRTITAVAERIADLATD